MTKNTKQKETSEKIWLHYYNQELYKRSIISELERNKMAIKIEGRKPTTKPITKEREAR